MDATDDMAIFAKLEEARLLYKTYAELAAVADEAFLAAEATARECEEPPVHNLYPPLPLTIALRTQD